MGFSIFAAGVPIDGYLRAAPDLRPPPALICCKLLPPETAPAPA